MGLREEGTASWRMLEKFCWDSVVSHGNKRKVITWIAELQQGGGSASPQKGLGCLKMPRRTSVVSSSGHMGKCTRKSAAEFLKRLMQMKMATSTTVVSKTVCTEIVTGTATAMWKRTGYKTVHCDVGVTPVSGPTENTLERGLPLCSALYSGEAGVKPAPVLVQPANTENVQKNNGLMQPAEAENAKSYEVIEAPPVQSIENVVLQ